MAKNKNKNKNKLYTASKEQEVPSSFNPYECGSDVKCGGNCQCDVTEPDGNSAGWVKSVNPSMPKPEGYENVPESEIPRDFIGDLPRFGQEVEDNDHDLLDVPTDGYNEENIRTAKIVIGVAATTIFLLGYGTSCLIKTLRS